MWKDFIQKNKFLGQLSEWGVPPGQMGRLIPSLIIKELALACLWVSDEDSLQIYPNYWDSLGIDLTKVFYLYDPSPLKNLREGLKYSEFSVIVLDLKGFVSPAQMHYLASYTREKRVACLLLRKYFLSPRNGNPFCKSRFNCSYSLRHNQLRMRVIKGKTQHFTWSPQELLHG